MGIRFRANMRSLPGKPDFVIGGKKVAVFVDGDFWHGGQWVRRKLVTLDHQFRKTRSRTYWMNKIRGNMRRDSFVTSQLLTDGWTVLRFWESDVNKNLRGCLAMTYKVLNKGAKANGLAAVPDKSVAEFFAGIGLMRLGLERQGWKTIFANDHDPDKYQMYRANFPDAESHFRSCDIATLTAKDIPTATLATASFPCNDLSVAGAREGLNGKQSSTFWSFVRILQGMGSRKPPIVLLENVPGFLTSHKGKDFQEALYALNALGYLVDCFMLDAASFVPQSRLRLFVVGVRDPRQSRANDEEIAALQATGIRPKPLIDFIRTHPQILWSIRPLPEVPRKGHTIEEALDDLAHHAKEWWSAERTIYLLNQMSPRHRKIAEFMIGGRRYTYGTVFRRIRNGKSMAELRTDGVAGCLRTPRGGSGRQILFKAGFGKTFARLLTGRECARLMGADDYVVSVPLNQALFGFGDAVCVPVVHWIAANYLDSVVAELMRSLPLTKAKTA